MATYIKGEKNFYPDIKPFTPDYKFLSATLDARQAKYNAGWKAQNDLYNKVVYSPLTNPNSLEYQRQYAEKLIKNAYKYAEKNYLKNSIISRYLDYYFNILGNKKNDK